MAMGRAHLRVVAIDGVALEDAPALPETRRLEPIDVVRQQREIRRMRDELRRLQRDPRRVPSTKR
jgi:hypothetical protein